MERSATSSRPAVWRRPAAAIAALALCVVLVAGMSWILLREIDRLSSSNTDNLQWSIAQADVEFLRFRMSLARADAARSEAGAGDALPDGLAPRLAELRQRFDVFYSRMSMIDSAPAFRALQDTRDFEAPRERVEAFVARTAAQIDGPDAALAAALPELERTAQAVGGDVRAFSLAALDAFAQHADQRQASLIRTLGLVATVLFVFIAGLSLLALAMMRLARDARDSATEARTTAKRLGTIVETSLDAIMVADQDGVVRDFNGAAERIFGYSRDEAIGRRARDLLLSPSQADEVRRMATEVLQARERGDQVLQPFEITATDRFGRNFPAEISIDRAEDSPNLVVSFLRDISLRKAQEEMLTQARDRALAGERSKSVFLAVMSHEMRTPLNGLLGSMQLLRDQDLDETQRELLDLMEASGQLLLNLVNDVLDLSKFEAGQVTAEARPFSVPRLLDGVVETTATLASANGNDLDWTWVGPETDTLVGDARRLRQVLLNLVTNAAKFTRGGSVDIEVEMIGADRTEVEFRVIDTGIGIDEEGLARIFNDFETLDSSYARQAGGSGLGLGIARRLAELMGGEIGAESEPGEGSLFWLRVPVTRAPLRAALPGEAEAEDGTDALPALAPLDVLLVEDNEINRYIAREMLESEGHNVTEAVDGQAGVEWAEAQGFDLILMDISMPVMDGTEAAARIRAGDGASSRTPIVALTAHALPEEIRRFRALGMSCCLSKPIDRAVLMACLADIAAGRDPGADEAAADLAPDDDLVDSAQVETLFSGPGKETAKKLLERFIAETEMTIEALAACPASKQEVARLAHACAGSCGTFGLVALRRALAEIETKAKRNQPVDPAELKALDPIWRASRARLDDRLAA